MYRLYYALYGLRTLDVKNHPSKNSFFHPAANLNYRYRFRAKKNERRFEHPIWLLGTSTYYYCELVSSISRETRRSSLGHNANPRHRRVCLVTKEPSAERENQWPRVENDSVRLFRRWKIIKKYIVSPPTCEILFGRFVIVKTDYNLCV